MQGGLPGAYEEQLNPPHSGLQALSEIGGGSRRPSSSSSSSHLRSQDSWSSNYHHTLRSSTSAADMVAVPVYGSSISAAGAYDPPPLQHYYPHPHPTSDQPIHLPSYQPYHHHSWQPEPPLPSSGSAPSKLDVRYRSGAPTGPPTTIAHSGGDTWPSVDLHAQVPPPNPSSPDSWRRQSDPVFRFSAPQARGPPPSDGQSQSVFPSPSIHAIDEGYPAAGGGVGPSLTSPYIHASPTFIRGHNFSSDARLARGLASSSSSSSIGGGGRPASSAGPARSSPMPHRRGSEQVDIDPGSPYPSTSSRNASISAPSTAVDYSLAAYDRPKSSAAAEDRPFACDICDLSFQRNHDLKRHKRIHLEVKPFPCPGCEKRFTRKDALKRHLLVKQHPGLTSDSSYDPDLVDAQYSSAAARALSASAGVGSSPWVGGAGHDIAPGSGIAGVYVKQEDDSPSLSAGYDYWGGQGALAGPERGSGDGLDRGHRPHQTHYAEQYLRTQPSYYAAPHLSRQDIRQPSDFTEPAPLSRPHFLLAPGSASSTSNPFVDSATHPEGRGPQHPTFQPTAMNPSQQPLHPPTFR